MHIPDGMLSGATLAASGAASTGFVAAAIAWVRRHFPQERVVLMAVMAALVFALQMLNFPVAGGTSGHFGGGAAVAILLGPWPAVIVLTTVLIVQSLLFADGGVLAIGANVLNMAVIAPFVAYLVWRALTRFAGSSRRRRWAVAFSAAWLAVVASAFAAAFEIWASGRAQFGLVAGAMGLWHALIGVGEGLITAGLVAYLSALRPDLLGDAQGEGRPWRWAAGGLAGLALVAAALSFVASTKPDGLEFVYTRVGAPVAPSALLRSPLPDYVVPGVANATLAGVLAAIAGVVVTGALLYGALAVAGAGRRRKRAARHEQAVHGHPHPHEGQPVEHLHPHHHTGVDAAHEHAHTLGFERLTYLVSPVHALDPRAKIVAALVFVLGTVLAPPPGAVEFVLLVGFLGAVIGLARLPLGTMLTRSALVLPVAGGIALFAPLALAGGSLSTGAIGAAYATGWPVAWAIVAKAWLSAVAVLTVSATTPPPRLFKALRSLRVPAVFLTLLTFLYRYADTLGDSVKTMRRAIASRAPALSGRRLVALYGNLAGNLFVRSYERGERIHAAMLARGYDGTLPTADALVWRATDLVPVTVAVLVAAATLLA